MQTDTVSANITSVIVSFADQLVIALMQRSRERMHRLADLNALRQLSSAKGRPMGRRSTEPSTRRRGGGSDVSAALVRLAGVSVRLALPILLVLTFYKLMSLAPPLPSAQLKSSSWPLLGLPEL